jgi:transposase-like protein
MKSLSHCPKCGDPLLNTYNGGAGSRYSFWTMNCDKRLDHKFYGATKGDSQDNWIDVWITFSMSPPIWIIWDFLSQRIQIAKEDEFPKFSNIPFFEPDFSNYPKLLSKIKTYVIFE